MGVRRAYLPTRAVGAGQQAALEVVGVRTVAELIAQLFGP